MGNACIPAQKVCHLCHENNVFLNPCVAACETCDAAYCIECWRKWIGTCEDQHLPSATCPHCRCRLSDYNVQALLGRPFAGSGRSRVLHHHNANQNQRRAHDRIPPRIPHHSRQEYHGQQQNGCESTTVQANQTMRQLGYRRCPNCRVWIERAGGCQAMQCLCGERFCHDCGRSIHTAPVCICGTTPACEFFNNRTGQHELPPPVFSRASQPTVLSPPPSPSTSTRQALATNQSHHHHHQLWLQQHHQYLPTLSCFGRNLLVDEYDFYRASRARNTDLSQLAPNSLYPPLLNNTQGFHAWLVRRQEAT